MFHKKPLQVLLAESQAEGGLQRTLTARNLVALGVGAIIGAGIFTLTGTAAATNPELPRPFKAPLFPLTPILGILVCGFLMVSLPWHTWERLLIWMALGLVIYFLYSKRYSKIGKLTRSAGKEERRE